MKNTKYVLVGVWCALLLCFAIARSTAALAAGGSSAATSSGQHGVVLAGQAPVLLADGGEGTDGTDCQVDTDCVNGDSCQDGLCEPGGGSGSNPTSPSGGSAGENGGQCDYDQYNTGCDTGLTCNSTGTCVTATTSGGSAGENGGQCDYDQYNTGCDTGLTCNSTGTCVAGSPASTSAPGTTGSACQSSNDCEDDYACQNNKCIYFGCNSAGQACYNKGETCQDIGNDNGLQCAPPGSTSVPNKPGSGSQTGGQKTVTAPAGSKVTQNPNGTVTVGSTTYPAGTTTMTDPLTGQVYVTTPNTSSTSNGGSTGIGTTPGVCNAGLGAFDSISLFPKICNFNDLVLGIVNVLLSVLAIIAALFIIIGGFRYVMSNGDETAAGKGLATVKNAAIGLAIAILAYAIIAIVTNTVSSLGNNSPSTSTTNTTTTSSGANPG